MEVNGQFYDPTTLLLRGKKKPWCLLDRRLGRVAKRKVPSPNI